MFEAFTTCIWAAFGYYIFLCLARDLGHHISRRSAWDPPAQVRNGASGQNASIILAITVFSSTFVV